MHPLRRYAFLFVSMAVFVVAAGCSSGSESVSEPPDAQATTAAAPASASTTVPTPVPPPTPAADPSEVASDMTGTRNQGLLQEQFCVTDVVAPDTLNVHLGPSADDAIVVALAQDQCRIFLLDGEATDWSEIVAEVDDEEVRGWVRNEFIRPLRAPIDPDAPMVTITISVEYEVSFPLAEATIDAFRLADAEGLVVGFLDTSGQITVPTALDLSRVRVEAEFADDPFCAWTGELQSEGDNRYTSPLEAICA